MLSQEVVQQYESVAHSFASHAPHVDESAAPALQTPCVQEPPPPHD
jgi:hypothetical protein